MTTAEWNKLTDSQKLDKIDERLVRMEFWAVVRLILVILIILGVTNYVVKKASRLV